MELSKSLKFGRQQRVPVKAVNTAIFALITTYIEHEQLYILGIGRSTMLTKLTYEYRGYIVLPVTFGWTSSAVAFVYSIATGKRAVIKKMKHNAANYAAIQN